MKEPPGRSVDTYCTGSRQDYTRPGELSLERSPSLARAEALVEAGNHCLAEEQRLKGVLR